MLGTMARIRIVDAWLRCPTSPPTYQRAVMVVAESWAEQRVLMHAYTHSPDQTRPTVALHGAELAIGPAGTDPHGPWGIHIEPPADGRAQRLRDELELAARRLAGSKGNPPRLMDEESPFDRKRTNHWAPGTPPDVAAGRPPPYYEPSQPGPAQHAMPAPAQDAAPGPMPARGAQARHAGAWQVPVTSPTAPTVNMPALDAAAAGMDDPDAPLPDPAPATTAFGFTPGAGAQLGAGARIGSPAGPDPGHTSRQRLVSVVRRTMPIGFELTRTEMAVLDALDAAPWLNAARVAEIAGVHDGGAWMQQLIEKLGHHGLDLIETLSGSGGEPAYALRR